MSERNQVRALLALVVSVLLLALFSGPAGCRGEQEYRPARISGLGESCQATNECDSELVCVASRCVQNEFPISPSSNVCVTLECSTDAECDDEVVTSFLCDQLEQDCAFGDGDACLRYEEECIQTFRCSRGVCIPEGTGCGSDDDCFDPNFPACVEQQCRQCRGDGDCDSGERCDQGLCIPVCQDRFDCPYFHECTGGACVEAGCANDRECVAFLNHALAVCNDRQCTIPCRADRDCSTVENYDFTVCDSGVCTYIGCTTDAECELQLTESRFGSRNPSAQCMSRSDAANL